MMERQPVHSRTSTGQYVVGESEPSLSHRLAAGGVTILLFAALGGAWVLLIGFWRCPLPYLWWR